MTEISPNLPLVATRPRRGVLCYILSEIVLRRFGEKLMVIPDKSRLYTVDEFEEFIARPENSDRLFELIEGEIVEKVPALEHGVVLGNIFGPVWNFTRERGIGRVAQDVRHRVPGDEHNARLPDIACYADKSKPLISRGATRGKVA